MIAVLTMFPQFMGEALRRSVLAGEVSLSEEWIDLARVHIR